jgi:VIT1/CCC1 family predicted Fe2+/Mn2+ transporter
MGINDGLVSTASLMMGVGAGADSLRAMQVNTQRKFRGF